MRVAYLHIFFCSVNLKKHFSRQGQLESYDFFRGFPAIFSGVEHYSSRLWNRSENHLVWQPGFTWGSHDETYTINLLLEGDLGCVVIPNMPQECFIQSDGTLMISTNFTQGKPYCSSKDNVAPTLHFGAFKIDLLIFLLFFF